MLNWIVWNRTDYFHKMDLALNNLQRLICHKKAKQPNLALLFLELPLCQILFVTEGLGKYTQKRRLPSKILEIYRKKHSDGVPVV